MNVFVGENNSGKTSILEAIQLMSNPTSAREFQNVSRLRERSYLGRRYTSSEDLLIWMFALKPDQTLERDEIFMKYQTTNHLIELKSSFEVDEFVLLKEESENNLESADNLFNEEVVKQVTIDVDLKVDDEINRVEHVFEEFSPSHPRLYEQKNPFFKASFITAIDHKVYPLSTNILNEMIKSGKRSELVKALQQFDPKIIGIELLMDRVSRYRTMTIPYIQHEELGLVPISMFGDGLRKALLIATRIIQSAEGVLLIDEIETGVHTKLIPSFFEWITQMCIVYKVQLFATTHSLEALDGILKANLEDVSSLSVFRLEGEERTSKIRRFSGEQLKKLRYTLGQDVR
ncbi:AAA ATPase [Sporosarcina newyorkensis 2681]|uniref:AAA ATPase n=2 Tax=Sporosarcina newyorkensis TaxID=759851 RepID=F9DQ78_9BACL|nr:AAA ATPase [Sporosarcina newyorkensis 2681]